MAHSTTSHPSSNLSRHSLALGAQETTTPAVPSQPANTDIIRRLDRVEALLLELTHTVATQAQITRDHESEMRDACMENTDEIFKTTKARLTDMNYVLCHRLKRVEKKVTAIGETIEQWDIQLRRARDEPQHEDMIQQPTPLPSPQVDAHRTQEGLEDPAPCTFAENLRPTEMLSSPGVPRLLSAVNWDTPASYLDSNGEIDSAELSVNGGSIMELTTTISQGIQCVPEDNDLQGQPSTTETSQGIDPASLHPASWFDLHREQSPLSTISDVSRRSSNSEEPKITVDTGGEAQTLGKRKTRRVDANVFSTKKVAKKHATTNLFKPYPDFKAWPLKPRQRPTQNANIIWIACSSCGFWYHSHCVGWLPREASHGIKKLEETWFCPPCQSLEKGAFIAKNPGYSTCARTDCASATEANQETEEEYVIERLLGKRPNARSRYSKYLVKWEGYPLLECTWEPLSKIPEKLIANYEARVRKEGVHKRDGKVELLNEASVLEWPKGF